MSVGEGLPFEYTVRSRALRDLDGAEYSRVAERRDRELEDFLAEFYGEFTDGGGGPGATRGIVARPGLINTPTLALAFNVYTRVSNQVSFTFKAGRTYRVVLMVRAVGVVSTPTMIVMGLFLDNTFSFDRYTSIASGYGQAHSEILLSYPTDTTKVVDWRILRPGSDALSSYHDMGGDFYIEDVTS